MTAARKKLQPARTTADEIQLIRQKYHGSLVCIQCARVIATSPAGYAKSNLTAEEVQAYVCAGCRQDTGVETRARLDALKSRVPIPAGKNMRVLAVGHPAPRGIGESERTYRARVAEHARMRPLALAAMGGVQDSETAAPACIFSGLHESADVLVECPVPGAARTKRTGRGAGLCAHARQTENCIICVTEKPLQHVRGGQVDRVGFDRPVSSLRGRRLHPAFRNARRLQMPVSRPGRPAKHSTDADRQQAYRVRRKQAAAAANDTLLAGVAS